MSTVIINIHSGRPGTCTVDGREVEFAEAAAVVLTDPNPGDEAFVAKLRQNVAAVRQAEGKEKQHG